VDVWASGSVEVEVPVCAAYQQWLQFESFPEFMDGVEQVDRLDDTVTHWITELNRVRRSFQTAVLDRLCDQRISWTSLDGPQQYGEVSFEELQPGRCRVTLRLDHAPGGALEQVGDRHGFLYDTVTYSLRRFAELMEVATTRRTESA
jgi:uncharacterized membrane protein